MGKAKQTNTPDKQTPTEKRTMTPAGGIAVVVVLLVFVAIGLLLSNRSQAAGIAQQAPHATTASHDTMHNNEATPSMNNTTHTEPMGEATATDDTTAHTEVTTHTNDTPQDNNTVSNGERKTYAELPPMSINPARSYLATISTPRGDIVVQLRPDVAPITVNNFVFLAREGFYNGLTWHRVIQGFMAQGGDPTGTGMGGAGYNVPAEFTDKILFDTPGVLAMARATDPNSASSQFFITTASAPHLNNQYTPFGEVIAGQDIVNGIPLRDPATATEPGEQIISITIAEE